MEDKMVEGAYRMHHAWALDHVLADQAVSGLRRLRRHLKDRGWKTNSYREGGDVGDWSPYAGGSTVPRASSI